MSLDVREFGLVGLGQIGGGLATQALDKGFRVVGYDKRPPGEDLFGAGLEAVTDLRELCERLAPPRIVFLYVPAGPAVDGVLDDLAGRLAERDIIVDGGNSYWGDSIRRHRRLAEQDIDFVDLGTSGGIEGARNGACFMAGGDKRAVEQVEPVLRSLAVDGGYVHAGPPGAGHFVKLVHNGIEFGMLQAIAEGVQLLESYGDPVPVADVLRCWRHGSVIRSWLIGLMEQQYRAQNRLENISDYIEDTGEVNWLVDDAMHLEVPVPVTALAVMQLISSRTRDRRWARAIAAMRHGFGGHPFGPDEAIARERHTGRVGPFRAPPGSTAPDNANGR
jgi:6-phosphogluconate dehydrogenase